MLTPAWISDGSPIPDPQGCGEKAVAWLKGFPHPKNRKTTLAGDPWQQRIIRAIYGPRHEDGSRIVRRVVLLLPRGNRKTSLAAALTLLHLAGPERQPSLQEVRIDGQRRQRHAALDARPHARCHARHVHLVAGLQLGEEVLSGGGEAHGRSSLWSLVGDRIRRGRSA